MTPREASAVRDVEARARLGLELPVAPADSPVVDCAVLAVTPRYPVLGVASFIECPVHQLAVALDCDGRLGSTCPGCVRDADDALVRLAA